MEDITQTDEFNEAMKDEFKHEPKPYLVINSQDERDKIIKDLTRRADTFQFTVEAIRSILDKKF